MKEDIIKLSGYLNNCHDLVKKNTRLLSELETQKAELDEKINLVKSDITYYENEVVRIEDEMRKLAIKSVESKMASISKDNLDDFYNSLSEFLMNTSYNKNNDVVDSSLSNIYLSDVKKVTSEWGTINPIFKNLRCGNIIVLTSDDLSFMPCKSGIARLRFIYLNSCIHKLQLHHNNSLSSVDLVKIFTKLPQKGNKPNYRFIVKKNDDILYSSTPLEMGNASFDDSFLIYTDKKGYSIYCSKPYGTKEAVINSILQGFYDNYKGLLDDMYIEF